MGDDTSDLINDNSIRPRESCKHCKYIICVRALESEKEGNSIWQRMQLLPKETRNYTKASQGQLSQIA